MPKHIVNSLSNKSNLFEAIIATQKNSIFSIPPSNPLRQPAKI